MKTPFFVAATAVLFCGALYFFLFQSNLVSQTVTTDKEVYSIGENVSISWTDNSPQVCTCPKGLQVYEKTPAGWVLIQHSLPNERFSSLSCIDGRVFINGHCDLIECVPRENQTKGNFVWNLKVYERTGTVTSCEGDGVSYSKGKVENYSMSNYVSRAVSNGTYRFVYGTAETTILVSS